MNSECNITVKTPAGITDEFKVKNVVQQGSVTGGILCSASTGEVNANIPSGGAQIGISNIRSLTFVDDIATINHTLQDTYNAHEEVVWFSRVKRLTLNVKKCVFLCLTDSADAVPLLTINGQPIDQKNVVVYLGDIFNRKGSNSDLVEDRVKKGKCCLVNAMSLCSDITMGIFAIETLLLLYKSLFLQIVLYNAQAWSNLNNRDRTNLQTIQLKYIKRIFRASSSTSNCLTFLETGLIPIEHEIHIKQLNFLYHILSLTSDDPVKITYWEQKKYPAASWANEVYGLRVKYGIEDTDDEIAELSKARWKANVKAKVYKYVFDKLISEAADQKHSLDLSSYLRLQKQSYITELTPARARTVFHLRTNTMDLRTIRKYQYGENSVCRLCKSEDETVAHIVNACPNISRDVEVPNVYTSNCEQLQKVADRCAEFFALIDDNGQI